ncbi:hypothetical protein BX666DRAFT_1469595 [Dichotomocladium elegans]|nr:hypothetical protein BX666DRAFT_1469595 [Dichotomocladium elegans]
MIFLNRNPIVRSFKLTISPGGSDRLVAFGPGAVMSGLKEIKPGGQILQAFLDLPDRTIETSPARVLYLPLVPCNSDAGPSRTQVFRRGSNVLEVTAQVAKAAYCRGDMCSVRLKTKNRSDYKITSVQLAFVAKHQGKTHTLHSETVYVAIGKRSLSNDTACHFTIPAHCLPSSTLDVFDLTYSVVITIPWGANTFTSSSAWKFALPSQPQSPCIMELPLVIASVPPSYQIPRHMPMPLPLFDVDYPILPSFIPSIESPPIPTPLVRTRDASSFGRGDDLSVSPTDSIDGRTLCDGWMPLGSDYPNHHEAAASNFLAIPGPDTARTRRASSSSIWTDCSAEAGSVFSDSSSQTRVAV